ncbi:hypothetical protein M501DRAFT_1037677, partial [Patellaria atrata CBS 101060]
LDEDEDAYKAIIYEKLPKEYHHLAHVFSKSVSDKLPPLREGVDHDIVLDQDSNLTTSPLYNMPIEHL